MTLISISNFLLSHAGNTTCPTNKDSVCSALPFNITNPPDVWLNVPNLSVNKILLVVDNLKVHLGLSAKVANLVSLNADADVSIDKVNLTITGKIYIKKF